MTDIWSAVCTSLDILSAMGTFCPCERDVHALQMACATWVVFAYIGGNDFDQRCSPHTFNYLMSLEWHCFLTTCFVAYPKNLNTHGVLKSILVNYRMWVRPTYVISRGEKSQTPVIVIVRRSTSIAMGIASNLVVSGAAILDTSEACIRSKSKPLLKPDPKSFEHCQKHTASS